MLRIMLPLSVLIATLGFAPAPATSATPPAAQAKTAAKTKSAHESIQSLQQAAQKLTGPIPASPDDSLAPRRQFLNGLRLESGYGVSANLKAALVWYERAAERGFAAAQMRAGDFHLYGIGETPVDMAKAAELYRRAAKQGYPQTQPLAAALDRIQRDPACGDSFCNMLRVAVADAEFDFRFLTDGSFNEQQIANAKYMLPGSSNCGIVDETEKELRRYVCVFKGAASDELVTRVRHALGVDTTSSHWRIKDDAYSFTPGPDCVEDPSDTFSDCAPDSRPAENWDIRRNGYIDFYEYDFDYAKYRASIPIADRISVEISGNKWGDGEGRMLEVVAPPRSGGPFGKRRNVWLYAYDTATSPSYTIAVDGVPAGKMKGKASNAGAEQLGLRVRDGVRKIRITDDVTGYWDEFEMNISKIFQHCFYDPGRRVNCMPNITHDILPVAHR